MNDVSVFFFLSLFCLGSMTGNVELSGMEWDTHFVIYVMERFNSWAIDFRSLLFLKRAKKKTGRTL